MGDRLMDDLQIAEESGAVIPSLRKGSKAVRTVQSVERAFDILELLANAEREMQLREITRATGLNSSTCHHLVATLVKRGYVGQNPRGRTYFISNKVLELSSSRLRQFDIVEAAMPELRRLNHATGESVHLAAMQGYDLTTLARLDSTRPVRVGTDMSNKANAAHATATGKAILAWLPETEIARVIAEKGLNRFTDRTITGIADLMEDLRHVRRNGYATDDEEFQPDVLCVGAAIRDHAGAVIGSISCSMPKLRAEGAHLDAVIGAVRQSTTIVSGLLGGSGDQSELKPDAA
jgi:IclR family acetate operon transcriptional repressor